ncbi:MAG: hypothetical protein F4Y35_08420 [Chloroflexi bacterium]|nr:hypothetical protein [Chloroflexota bacterium]
MAAVDLQHHPFARHPRPPHAVLGRPSPARDGHAGHSQDAAHRKAAQGEPLVLPEQFAEIGVVGARVAIAGEADHYGGH